MTEAIFAAGCFWGVEDAFRKLDGVTDAQVGYIGGTTNSPSYEQVCSGNTGHAEAVRVVFDEARVSYEELLTAFFRLHDPRQVNRQGPDIGSQYRSAIFVMDEAQNEAAHTAKTALDKEFAGGDLVATEIAPAQTFWPAEDYHQQFFAKQRGSSWMGRFFGD